MLTSKRGSKVTFTKVIVTKYKYLCDSDKNRRTLGYSVGIGSLAPLAFIYFQMI